MKRRFIILIILSFAVVTGLYFYFFTKAEFAMGSHSFMKNENLVETEGMYMGYGLTFDGTFNPTIQDVYLIQPDGKTGQPNDEQISITPFIDENGLVGVVDETYAIEEGITDELIPVNGYTLTDHEVNLAFRVELKDQQYEKDFDTLVIEYRYLGFVKKQYLDFEGLFK